MIIEDDPSSVIMMKQYCNRTKLIDLKAVCTTAVEALSCKELLNIELIFLDVEMPTMNGFDFLNRCEQKPKIVITSSKPKYAVEAFEYEALDFLPKPFRYSRFQQALAKVQELDLNKEESNFSHDARNYIFLKENGRWIRISLDDILFFENEGDYVKVKTIHKQYLVYRTMKSIAESLESLQFLRIHRSFIVNLDKIVDIEDNTLVIGRSVIPIGKAHKAKLMKALPTL